MKQREIKFRAWDGFKMYEPCVWMGKEYQPSRDSFIETHLMQFTGLQDKNGKEIYEGDILQKFEKDYDSDEYRAWQDSGYEGDEPPDSKRTVDYCTLESFRMWLKNESFGYEGEELQSPDDWEVIGNIYENTDLLK